MMGGAKAHYDGIVAFSQTDFTEDLKAIRIPVLVMHGDDDQIVPHENAGVLSAKLLENGTLKIYPASRTACRPSMPRRSTPICSLSCVADWARAMGLAPWLPFLAGLTFPWHPQVAWR